MSRCLTIRRTSSLLAALFFVLLEAKLSGVGSSLFLGKLKGLSKHCLSLARASVCPLTKYKLPNAPHFLYPQFSSLPSQYPLWENFFIQ
jgi:hypothetical protein